MLSLSPAKIFVVLIVALLVLGPEKLPGMARQIGAAWGDLRRWRAKLESEVRGAFPDLPPTHEVAQAVRSPFAFLDRLADQHERGDAETGDVAREHGAAEERPPPAADGNRSGWQAPPTVGPPPPAENLLPAVPDDPSMN